MSLRWPNSIVNKTFTAPTGAQSTPGLWKLNTVAEYVQQALWPQPPTYIEDVFSTYLYTGNSTGVGSSQTITNGIDLAGQGGMVWIKDRSTSNIYSNAIIDTARGRAYSITTDNTWGESTSGPTADLTSFNNNGFSLGYGSQVDVNDNGANYASWTFREAPKFFDVVTYTGNGAGSRTIAHSLGVAPGMIIIKNTGASTDWAVWHRGDGSTWRSDLSLNLNSASGNSGATSLQTSTNIQLSQITTAGGSGVNSNGYTYVAYLFAHDTTTDGLIQCGSYTGTGSAGNTVTLGWEPQYVLVKNATTGGLYWYIEDTMRGMSQTSYADLYANTSDAEASGASSNIVPTATGFQINVTGSAFNASGSTYIYMAIRRGPMKTPTDPTKVFDINTFAYSGTPYRSYSGFVTDMSIDKGYAGTYGVSNWQWQERLSGPPNYMKSNSDAAQSTNSNLGFDYNDGVSFNNSVSVASGSDNVHYQFQRAPGFFDFVIAPYAAGPVSHNLGVVPELVIVKQTTGANSWYTWTTPFTTSEFLTVNTTNAKSSFGYPIWATQTATQTGFLNLGISDPAAFYLFATCPGVSKVGSFTTTGSAQNIDCGFTAGARFILAKCTNATSSWFVWDTSRGMYASDDPWLAMQSDIAQQTGTNFFDYYASGFTLTTAWGAGGDYIFLAIA